MIGNGQAREKLLLSLTRPSTGGLQTLSKRKLFPVLEAKLFWILPITKPLPFLSWKYKWEGKEEGEKQMPFWEGHPFMCAQKNSAPSLAFASR